VAPRTFSDAILDGHRLAREIDRPNPTVPAPALSDGTAALRDVLMAEGVV